MTPMKSNLNITLCWVTVRPNSNIPQNLSMARLRIITGSCRPSLARLSVPPGIGKNRKVCTSVKQPKAQLFNTRTLASTSTPKRNGDTDTSQGSAGQSTTGTAEEAAKAREAALRAARLRRHTETKIENEVDKSKRNEHKEKYDIAARKWVSAMIALPILIVTSYYLFDRLALGHAQKTLPRGGREDQSTA